MTIETTLVLALLLTFFGGIVSGLAGFGFGLVVVPPLLMLYSPPTVTAVACSLTLATGWIILAGTWREVQGRTVLGLVPGATIGVAVGTVLIRALDPDVIKLIAGSVVFLFALSLGRGWRLNAANSPAAAPIAGFFSGTLSTSTGMAGPPVALLFTTRQYDPLAFRASITAYFYYVNLIAMSLLIGQGIVGRSELEVVAQLLPTAIVGSFVGRRLLRRFSHAQFRSVTLAMLLATGAIGVVTALRGLAG